MKSLTRFRQQKPIVVDVLNQVIAGNGTFTAMQRLKWVTCSIVRTALKGAEAEAYAIADNKTGDLSEFDFEKLAKVMKYLDGQKIDLDVTGFRQYEREPLLQADWSPPEVNDDPVQVNPKHHTVTFNEEQWQAVQEYIKEIQEVEIEYDVASDASAIQMGLYYGSKHLN